MSHEKHFSDEFLNAFVDNQLASEEKGRAYIEISQNETLNRQVCELRKMHDLVQLAYRDVPPPPAKTGIESPRRKHLRFGVAASVLMAVGIAIGIQAPVTQQIAAREDTIPVAVKSDPATAVARKAKISRAPSKAIASTASHAPEKHTVAAAVAAGPKRAATSASVNTAQTVVFSEDIPISNYVPVRVEPRAGEIKNKVLIHVATDDTHRLSQALDEVEGLMRFYRENNQSAHVEVVANGRGLDLLRRDTSSYAKKISKLQKEFDNLTFAACQNTIDRLKREQGISVRLLPGVIVIDSGMAEIMRRQNQGWTYLQV